MPRLRNTATGVIVNVPDEKVAQLGSAYEPVGPQKGTAAKKAAAPTK